MANILLKPTVDAGTVLTPFINNPANGIIVSTEAVILVADDVTEHEDLIEISATINGGTAGESVTVTVSEGNTAAEYDGNVPVSSSGVLDTQLVNCQVPFSVIADTGVQRSTGVFRITKSRFIVVVKNNCTAALTNLLISYRRLNYESV